jgi:hypothetical protein
MENTLNLLSFNFFFEFAALLVVVSHQKIVHIISAYEETEVTPIRKSYSFNHRKKFCGQGMPGNTKGRRG